MERQYPDTDLQAYCKTCRANGGCDAGKGQVCPRPQVLPENVPALRAYELCSTQWRMGFDGATGLDYAGCTSLLERYLPRWEKEPPTAAPLDLLEVLDGLRTLEDALLTAWAERRNRNKAADE